MIRLAKSIESAGKSLLLRLVSAVFSRRRPAPDWSARPYRVLYIRHDGIGDMILATGTLRSLARSHPTIELDVLTHGKTAEMLHGNPHIREIIAFRPGRRLAYPVPVMRRIRERQYDAVVDGMLRRYVDGTVQRARVKSSTVLLMLTSGARHRIGMGGRPNDFVYSYPVTPPDEASVHHAEYSASVGVPFGVDPASADLRCEIHISAAERSAAEKLWLGCGAPSDAPRVLVNISAANARRRWPANRFIEVIRHVNGRAGGACVMVIGAPDESAEVSHVASASGGFALAPTLRAAFALVATAHVLLTPETSHGHAAAALGTRVVVLLPAGHEMLVPYRAAGRNLFGVDGTILSISASEAMVALDSVLESRA